ncbi:MAG TPA: septal ring lytic transglycosylase RlpA family protein [Thermoanaerobaculia bacterium]|jgi:rare lipoprotein A|nr:septal ring lytic transglycosylase RlpA family protein [Thermoanaerobaculia bacterium]
MRSRITVVSMLVVLAYGCATTSQPLEPRPQEILHGVASWYGEEFAGRTTANGEIFDPALFTAAHRTFPFGTVLDISNPKTTQTVRVRVNDRGPYIGNRVIDLSYAAAQQIGLIEPGIGDVDILIVRVGSGEREPPAPFEATIVEAPKAAPMVSAGDPPKVEFPLPTVAAAEAPAPEIAAVPEPVVVDRITVETLRGDVITRKQVADDGRTLEDVPVAHDEAPTASSYDAQRKAAPVRRAASALKQFMVQVGAFSVEANAKSLQERLTTIGHRAFIDREALYRVRIGPFTTREQAVAARASLEANGISAMIVSE